MYKEESILENEIHETLKVVFGEELIIQYQRKDETSFKFDSFI